MREILFRGKPAKGEWVYGYHVKFRNYKNEVYSAIIPKDEETGEAYMEDLHSVIPETVGQFTGLTDKNGKKIFEGDIVRLEDYWDEGKVFIVKYTDDKVGSCGCCFPEFGGIGFVMEAKDGERVCYDKDVIVIGNVTDNTELLESD